MSIAQPQRVLNVAEVAALDAQHVARMLVAKDTAIDQLKQQNQALQHQLEWFKRQLFGARSERFADARSATDAPGSSARTGLAPSAERGRRRAAGAIAHTAPAAQRLRRRQPERAVLRRQQ